MSEMYEGVVLRSNKRTALHTFCTLSSLLQLRLVHLARGVYGIYRIADRHENFDQPGVEQVAKQISVKTNRAVALLYDNRCGIQIGVLYTTGRRKREFGDEDAWWVPFGEDGAIVVDGPRFRESEMKSDQEYDCVFSAIDAALEAVGVWPRVSALWVKQAFCYDKGEVVADRCGPITR